MMQKFCYVFSKYLTFIGTAMKGFWEHVYCQLSEIFVEDARYFQANILCGHVDHTMTTTRTKSFLVCWIPGLINAIFGFAFAIGGYLGLFNLRVYHANIIFWVYIVMLYLGISFLTNLFPLYEDALNNWDMLYNHDCDEQTKQTILKQRKELKEKAKADKAANALAMKQYEAEQKASKNQHTNKTKEANKPPVLKKVENIKVAIPQTPLVWKILLFIPSLIMLVGSFLEKYGLTLLINIIIVVLSVILFVL